MDEIEDLNCGLEMPFQPDTLEDYYKKIDECIKQNPKYSKKLNLLKNDLRDRNNKEDWSIVKFFGKSNDNFTNGVYYYVSVYKNGNKYYADGLIDDEESIPYIGWDDIDISTDNFEIICDPHDVLKK